MNKPSERIVVFVTPAQKRAIAATADELGISVSELMRRAVIAFSATSDQVKAASIVDRLNAPREPDALAQVLRRAAKPQRQSRGSPLRLAPAPTAADAEALAIREDTEAAAQDDAAHDAGALRHAANGASPEEFVEASAVAAADAQIGNAAREIGQAIARLAAEAEDAEAPLAGAAGLEEVEPMQSLGGPSPFARTTHPHGDADARHDGQNGGAPEDGKFA
ncbi:hypothetical protein WJ542_12555 [Paraburkholderia sp. B3]|uniref:hypothetical protein n=1 Tax=Paraburkholderia sp. B3 TaxID=3134791 RepID=UPI003981E4D8